MSASTHDSRSTSAPTPTDESASRDAGANGAAEEIDLPQVFRLSKLAYFTVPAALLVCLFMAGASLAWWGWTFVLPILLAIWITRIKTVVTEDGLRAVGTFGTREVNWAEIDGLRFTKWGPVRAVLADDTSVRLPALTFQDLPRLSLASHGRIPDPFDGAR